MVQAPWFDSDQDLVQGSLAAVNAEGCDGHCGYHAANKTSCDFPVRRVLRSSVVPVCFCSKTAANFMKDAYSKLERLPLLECCVWREYHAKKQID